MLYYYCNENKMMKFGEKKKLKNVLGREALTMDNCKLIKTAENTKQKNIIRCCKDTTN